MALMYLWTQTTMASVTPSMMMMITMAYWMSTTSSRMTRMDSYNSLWVMVSSQVSLKITRLWGARDTPLVRFLLMGPCDAGATIMVARLETGPEEHRDTPRQTSHCPLERRPSRCLLRLPLPPTVKSALSWMMVACTVGATTTSARLAWGPTANQALTSTGAMVTKADHHPLRSHFQWD